MKIKTIRGKGRGVVSERHYSVGEVVEICHVIPIPEKEWKYIASTILEDYVYTWPGINQQAKLPMADWKAACVCLGNGSLFNHSSDANLSWRIRKTKLQIVFFAVKNISPGDELTHDYGWPDSKYKELKVKK